MTPLDPAKVRDAVLTALPPPTAEGLDYHELRERVRVDRRTIRQILQSLIEQKRAEALRGGLRGRKVFRKASPEGARP